MGNPSAGDPATYVCFAPVCDRSACAAVFLGSSSDFAKFMATETEKWAKMIKFSGAKAD